MKAPLIKTAFQLYATGTYSIQRLSNYLYDQGLRTYQGNKLVASRLHTLLSDSYYVGVNIWNNQEYDNAKQEPLISHELFSKVQKQLKSKTTAKYQKHNFLFRGLLKCGECGGTITWETHKGITYGHCTKYKPCSQKKWLKEKELEQQILFALKLLQIKNKRIMEWIRKALKEGNNDVLAYQVEMLKELTQKLVAIEKRLSNLYDDKVDEIITKEFYNQKETEYKQEKNTINQTIKKYNNAGDKYRELGINLYEVSQQGKELFVKKLPEKKRLLLGLIFAKLAVENGALTYELTKAFQILAKLVELTNNRSKVDKKDENVNPTIELEEKIDYSTQTPDFAFLHSDVRRGWDSNPRPELCPDNRFRDGPVTTTSVPLQTLCTREESNLQPLGPQPSVLSIELRVHKQHLYFTLLSIPTQTHMSLRRLKPTKQSRKTIRLCYTL